MPENYASHPKQTSNQDTAKVTKPPVLSEEKEAALLEKWNKRFDRAKDHWKPIREKRQRMYELYRAYRRKQNYAYHVGLMPPIGFRIVQTVIARLISSKIRIHTNPVDKKDAVDAAVAAWGDLAKHGMKASGFYKEFYSLLFDMVYGGDSYVKHTWNRQKKDPVFQVIDPDSILLAPEAPSLDETPWLIHISIKNYDTLCAEEKAREEAGTGRIYSKIPTSGKYIEDWTKARYEINTKKMAQVDDYTKQKKDGTDTAQLGNLPLSDKHAEGNDVLIAECWSYETNELITFMNAEMVSRYEEKQPYLQVNNGRIFGNLQAFPIPHEPHATAYLEPVETTIHEIADNRNHRMDDIVLNISPVLKVKKSAGLKKEDLVMGPNIIWQLQDPERDVIIERPPPMSMTSLKEEELMKNEVNETLSLTEYQQGQAQSGTEPLGKVAMLLNQANLGLSVPVDNLQRSLKNSVNIIIQMYQAFLDEDKYMRIIDDDKKASFVEFKISNRDVNVDAEVEVEPILPKGQSEKMQELNMLWQLLVAPGPTGENDQLWAKRKTFIEKKIIELLDDSTYTELSEQPPEVELAQPGAPAQPQAPDQPAGDPMTPPAPPAAPGGDSGIKGLMQKIPLLNKFIPQ